MPTFESRNRHRRITAALGALGVLALVVACAPETEPDPEPTGFATEEEALEAARETYEGYVEATNGVDLADLETAEPVYGWLTEDALTSARKAYSEAHAEGTTRSGASTVLLFELGSTDLAKPTIAAFGCLDVSKVDVLDANGKSIVSTDRLEVQPVLVELVASDSTPTGLVISNTTGREGEPTCDPSSS
ncbi:MAG: hypothetical protein ACTHU7_06485 [Microbacterium sp.]